MNDRQNIGDWIDLSCYPIHDTESISYQKLIWQIRDELEEVGCAVLKQFVKKDCVSIFADEAKSVAKLGHRSFNRTNPYFGKDNPKLESSHPIRRFYDRSNSFVPADNFGKESPLRRLYEWPSFMPFIQQGLDEPNFYRYADPLADVIVNVVEDGEGFPWHFDTNNYTVTLAIQNGESGGVFEYAPNLRTQTEENYEGVRKILDGDTSAVNQLHLEPGDLQIFKGRYALHRVSAVRGDKKRFVGIFSFVEQPGMVAKVERAKQLYGRALPIHYEKQGERLDLLLD